MGTRGSFPAS